MRVIINNAWSLWLLLQMVKGDVFECPELCTCNAPDIAIKCLNKGLTDLPNEIYEKVLQLDLSINDFKAFPERLSFLKQLQYLNMSYNKLTHLDGSSLLGLRALEVLDLSRNLFSNWIDINVAAFIQTPSLQELRLSYNPLGGLPDVNYPIRSDSLMVLYLVNCSITSMVENILERMMNVHTLILSNNPLTVLNAQIKSETLQTLDLSQCSLMRINQDAFMLLTSLETLLISKNYQLKRFNSKSNSLKYLDLSDCNLESVPTSSIPNLTKVSFKGNHLRYILPNNFGSFPLIQTLDLSNNAIQRVDVKAFQGLTYIQNIDLSFNTLTNIVAETFMSNTKLHKLNLSRNYLSIVGQLISESLRVLDLSVCEIKEITRDSLIMMPKLQKLNLSRNFISQIPNRLQADELTVLDISRCGIYSLNQLTFAGFARLRTLNIAGNRLTSGIKPAFFYGVTDLRLDDNTWLCDCSSDDFRELYQWLFTVLASTTTLRCRSPETMAGLTWEAACQNMWFTTEENRGDGMWIYSVSLVVLMTFLCCVVISIRHIYHRKVVRERETQEREREDARDRLRQIQQRNLQYSRESVNRNAPDPRELQTPPSYAEAVSMPRLNMSCNNLAGSHRSLHSLHSSHPDISSRRTKLRRKRRRSRQENKSTVSETQSAASLSHANSEASNSEDEFRPTTRERNMVIESNF